MKHSLLLPLWLLGCLLAGLPGLLPAQCVFFSEYIEGSGNNKCLEIYNGTGAPLDLAAGGYEIAVYNNGAATPNTVTPLTGVIAAGEVFVICNPGAAAGMLAEADATSGNMNYNGDDAVELRGPGGLTLDVIGQIGVDPGTGWTGSSCGTLNQTLLRDPALGCPSFDGSSAFGPQLDAEWTCLPQDDFSDLGSFTAFACGLSNLSVTLAACNTGLATASLDFTTTGAVGAQFTLTVTPDPGGLSGLYAYAALPLSLPGLTGDAATLYDFAVADAGGSCAGTSVSGLSFDCPVADALSVTAAPAGCVAVGTPFQVTVCAVETSSGGVQPDYNGTISLTPGPGATGSLTAGGTAAAVNGCATISLVYDTEEMVAFEATDGSLAPGLSALLDLRTTCPGLVMTAGMVNPCGDDSPNEYIAAVTQAVPVDVGQIVVASVDPFNGPQPNTNYTWAALDTALAGNPAETCGVIGLQCNRWLDINDAADAAIINALVGDLNTQAGCPLFNAPLPGGDRGTLPANSQVIFFLGAGGNFTGTIAPGFDGLGTNLDFSGYCGQGPIYAVIGQHKNTAAGFGFFSNANPRSFHLLVAGTQMADFPYTPATPPGPAPQYVDFTGALSSSLDCTPPDLFGGIILAHAPEALWAEPVAGQGVWLAWEAVPGLDPVVERARGSGPFEVLAALPDTGATRWLDRRPAEGLHRYRLRGQGPAGEIRYSAVASLYLEAASLPVRWWPQPAGEEVQVALPLPGPAELWLLDAQGRAVAHWAIPAQTAPHPLTLSLRDLPAGLYSWRLVHAQGQWQGRLLK